MSRDSEHIPSLVIHHTPASTQYQYLLRPICETAHFVIWAVS